MLPSYRVQCLIFLSTHLISLGDLNHSRPSTLSTPNRNHAASRHHLPLAFPRRLPHCSSDVPGTARPHGLCTCCFVPSDGIFLPWLSERLIPFPPPSLYSPVTFSGRPPWTHFLKSHPSPCNTSYPLLSFIPLLSSYYPISMFC